MHPEGGHVPVRPLDGDTFCGYSWGETSPFQGKQTVEGIACSVALTERLSQLEGKNHGSRHVLADLPDDHEVWDHAANALANLCVTLLLTVSIEKIILGGGIMKRKGLLEKIQSRTVVLLNGYIELPEDMSTLINTSKYEDEAGLMGAIVLAQRAYLDDQEKQQSRADEDGCKRYKQGFVQGLAVGAALAIVSSMILAGRRKT
jgi:fructokinase